MAGTETQEATQDALSGLDRSHEYNVHRSPDLTTITQGAEIAYGCRWIGPGGQPTVASRDHWGPRDGVHWYLYSARPPRHFWQNQLRSMHAGFVWRHRWDDDPGFYAVIAVIRSRLALGAAPTRCSVSQQVGETGAILHDSFEALLAKGEVPPLPAVKAQVDKYVQVLQQIEERFPVTDPRRRQHHHDTVARWREYAGRLAALLAKTEGRRRVLVRGLHIESATQVKRPLFLFLVDMGEVHHPQPRGGGVVTRKKWMLVDWTNAEDPRFRGEHEGEGATPEEAITSALGNWDWSNRYPKGHVVYDIPGPLQGLLAGPARRRIDTNGTNLTEEVIEVLGWIALGAMVVSGACALFVAVPALGSAAFATALASSTGGAVLGIAERRRQGIFDWRGDVIDGLTVVANLLGAGAWARGARVTAPGGAGKKVDYVFIGPRAVTDAVQGVLIAEAQLGRLTAVSEDPDLLPEERARQSLKVIAELAALGLLTYVSTRATGRERDHLDTKPEHLLPNQVTSPDQLRSIRERLEALTDQRGKLDLTVPPVSEGHTIQTQSGRRTRTGRHTTTVAVTEAHRPPPRVRDPEQTDFARLFPDDENIWRERIFDDSQILLVDHEGFVFQATCKAGRLSITIVTRYDPAKHRTLAPYFPGVSEPIKSNVLKAPVVIPKMYEHFEQVGNPVKRLKGSWAWDNYDDAKKVFDAELRKGATEKAAARIAVKQARTYKAYHEPRGFTKVVKAEHDAFLRQFHFQIEKE